MKLPLSIIGMLVAGVSTLAAQPASIRGQVTDPSGKSIPDAIVSFSNLLSRVTSNRSFPPGGGDA